MRQYGPCVRGAREAWGLRPYGRRRSFVNPKLSWTAFNNCEAAHIACLRPSGVSGASLFRVAAGLYVLGREAERLGGLFDVFAGRVDFVGLLGRFFDLSRNLGAAVS